jgi:hypothetical protein
MVDRRQRKLEKKRKKRHIVRQESRLARDQRPQRLVASARRAPFGPCALSLDWDSELLPPGLVTAVVTRVLGNGSLLPSVALVDRTCVGIKNGFLDEPLEPSELSAWLDDTFAAHGGWEACEPLQAQSIVFHALDYAQRLGFRPHPDAELALFEPRPNELLPTALHACARPIYVSGPHDNVSVIISRLTESVGADGFDLLFASELEEVDESEFDELEFGESDLDDERALPRG